MIKHASKDFFFYFNIQNHGVYAIINHLRRRKQIWTSFYVFHVFIKFQNKIEYNRVLLNSDKFT